HESDRRRVRQLNHHAERIQRILRNDAPLSLLPPIGADDQPKPDERDTELHNNISEFRTDSAGLERGRLSILPRRHHRYKFRHQDRTISRSSESAMPVEALKPTPS